MIDTLIATKYSNDVYNDLPHFHDAKDQLEANVDAIPHLGDVICEYGLHEHLGVSLLHKHFPLYEGEQLAKRYDPEKKIAYMYPEAVDRRHHAYMYQVTGERDEIAYEPIEFFSRSKVTADVPTLAEIVDGKEEFLEEFAAVARKLGVTNTFGLTILHLYIQEVTQSEEMPMEVTDEEKRILKVTIEPREELNPETTTETLWVFTPQKDVSAGSVGDLTERFGPAHECSHSCSHTCNHTCNHTCVHTGEIPDFTDLPSDIPHSPPRLPEQQKSSWRSTLGRLFGRSNATKHPDD